MRRLVVWLSLALTLVMSASLPLAPRSRAQLLDGVTTSLNQTLNQTLSPGQKMSIQVTLPGSGTVQYHCNFHQGQGMQGAFAVA